MSHIIGLVGFKQSGKSTAAAFLEKNYGFTRHNFKDALILELKEYFPNILAAFAVMYSMTIDELFTNKPAGVRELMMDWGMKRRAENPDYWVDVWEFDQPKDSSIVVDDTRFLNEARKIRVKDGIIIRIIQTGITTGGDHRLETEHLQIEADYVIEVAHGELDKLEAELSAVMSIITGEF